MTPERVDAVRDQASGYKISCILLIQEITPRGWKNAPVPPRRTPRKRQAGKSASGQICQVIDLRPCLRAPHPVRRRAAALVRQSAVNQRALEAPASSSPMVISLASAWPRPPQRTPQSPPGPQIRRLPRRQPAAKLPGRPRRSDRCGMVPGGSFGAGLSRRRVYRREQYADR